MTTSYKIDLTPDVDYRPSGVLEIDARPIDGDDIKTWRVQMFPFRGTDGYRGHPTQVDCAERFGVSVAAWAEWEQAGCRLPYRTAILREWMRDPSIELNHDDIPIGHVRELAHLCGGFGGLAEEIGLSHSTLKNWTWKGTPSRANALFWWLTDVMDLGKRERLVGGPDRKLTVAEVREIRRRHEAGEGYRTIAKDYPVTWPNVRFIVKRDIYDWVQ